MKSFDRFKQTCRVTKEVIKLTWKASPGYAIYTIALLMLTALIPIAQAYIIKKIIDNLTLALTIQISFSIIVFYIGLFVLITLFNRLVENQRTTTQIILGNIFNKFILHKIVEKTTKLDFWRFEDPKFHDKLDRTRDQATWKPLNTFYCIFDSVQHIFTILSVFIVLYALSPILVLLMILFTAPSLWVQIKFGSLWWSLMWQETADARRLQYYQHIMLNIHEMKDIKLLNLRKYLLGKYKLLFEKLFKEQKKLIVKRYASEFIAYLFSDIILIFFYVFLAWQTFMRKTSIGDFTFYSTLYTRAINSLHGLMRSIAGIYENNLFINEMLEFLNLDEEKRPAKAKLPKKISKGFEFKNVWFRYPGTDNWVLKDVSFKMPVKKSIALVGENGSGKTTIVKLLTRLFEPTRGEILLDGAPINQFDIEDYRQLFGVTFQDFAKFYFSAKDNICFGDINRKIPKDEIRKTAKKTQIHKKIMSLPDKYDTLLGRWYHEGHEISHGEWQRLAIARALIRKCSVYVLDEPTAALDAKAEYKVFKQFKKHIKGKSALFISHRFSNVKLADWILVLENSKIIQRGAHRELLKRRGRYKELYNFQAERFKEKGN